jgi:hypothetical protein
MYAAAEAAAAAAELLEGWQAPHTHLACFSLSFCLLRTSSCVEECRCRYGHYAAPDTILQRDCSAVDAGHPKQTLVWCEL